MSKSKPEKTLDELLDDPEAIQELIVAFDCDEETAKEMWGMFVKDLFPEIKNKQESD
jgi:tryptophanyl-tRNA synthetase